MAKIRQALCPPDVLPGREEDRTGFENRQILDLNPCFPLITQDKEFVLSLSFPTGRLYSLAHGADTRIQGDWRREHPEGSVSKG